METDVTWRLTGNTLVLRHPVGAVGPRWDLLGLLHSWSEVLTLTPDGPSQFRYAGAIEAGGKPLTPTVSGTLTRSDASP
jgi:hypothetical protein